MNNMKNKIFSLLVLLMTAATGAWADDYYLVGTMNDWGPSKQFEMTPNNEVEYKLTLSLQAGAEFKVVAVDSEGNWTWYPGDGGNYVEGTAGKYTVYFRPDGSGDQQYWHYGYIYLAAAPAPAIPVTDLGSGQWQFTMPDYAVVANIEYDTELELRDVNVNTTVLADWDGYEADVTLQRKLIGGTWNTLAVPFDTDIPEGWTVKELTGASLIDGVLNLSFSDAASITAGSPYLVKVTTDTDLSDPKNVFKGVTVNKNPNTYVYTDVDFVPTLGATTIEGTNAKSVLFLAAENKLKNPTSLPADIKGFRAYFQLKGDAANARVFNLDLGEGETTGISTVSKNNVMMNNDVYDLQGRKVQNAAQKGIYIMNGRKVVNK